MNDLERITSGFSLLPMVEAVALSGSRTCMINDGDSDYDIYVYSSEPVPPERREEIVTQSTSSRRYRSAARLLKRAMRPQERTEASMT